MNPSNIPSSRPNRAELLAQLYAELTLLRNALVSLSFNLKDLQFEVDQSGQHDAHKIVSEVLDKCKLQRPINTRLSEISRPSAS
jgi:hypothetical protein